jgi:hypothetical protein
VDASRKLSGNAITKGALTELHDHKISFGLGQSQGIVSHGLDFLSLK